MLHYPIIDPVAVSLGPLKVHWYGLMYVLGFLSAWWLGTIRARHPASVLQPEQVGDLIFYAAIGVILGGRIGYMLIYDLSNLIAQPILLFKIWQGGMSFHGGLLGVIIALSLYARKLHKPIFDLVDFIAPLVPIGLGAGRIGNFINGELAGRVTDVPWAMIFPHAGPVPRHPSQLYEFFLEGVVLFIVMWCYSAKPRPRMAVSGMFALGYGVARTIAECFREPDAPLGFIIANKITMGQLLSIPLIIGGIIMLLMAYKKPNVRS